MNPLFGNLALDFARATIQEREVQRKTVRKFFTKKTKKEVK